MKKLRENGMVKGIAVALFAILTMAVAFSAFGVAFCMANELYTDGSRDFYDTWYAQSALWDFLEEVRIDQENGDLPELAESCRQGETNFDFRLSRADADGQETKVLRDTVQEDRTYSASRQLLYERGVGSYSVTVYLRDPLAVRSGELYQLQRMYETFRANRTVLLAALIVSALLLLADTIFLCCAAGHRKGREGITLNWADKIPLDLYAAAMALPCILGLYLLYECLSMVNFFWNLLGLLWAVLAALPALAVLLSLCARVKAGGWWRNTLTYRLLRFLRCAGKRLCRAVLDAVRALPMVWRAVAGTGVILFFLYIVAMEAAYDGIYATLYFFLSLILLAAVGFGVLQLRRIQKAGEALAAGRLETRIDTKRMYWDFRRHAEHLNAISDGMAIALEQRMKSERLKTELITNVSHDIKTPLTSIINYVDLLQKPHSEAEGADYLQVLQRQSARLKKLTEDLLEASKASTGNLPVELSPTDASESVRQAIGEYQARLEAAGLQAVCVYPEAPARALADGRLLWRVLDNLLGNVCKYALAGTRVYVEVRSEGEQVAISLKNISRDPLNVSAEELMERFVRGDAARSSEGSGLGLNIARSLAELQHGTLTLSIDGDLFKADLTLRQAENA